MLWFVSGPAQLSATYEVLNVVLETQLLHAAKNKGLRETLNTYNLQL